MRFLIGATSYYVTAALDEGPIIEQDVVRVSHRGTVGDMLYKGSDLEKVVLSRTVRWRLENRILVYENKTVVFVQGSDTRLHRCFNERELTNRSRRN